MKNSYTIHHPLAKAGLDLLAQAANHIVDGNMELASNLIEKADNLELIDWYIEIGSKFDVAFGRELRTLARGGIEKERQVDDLPGRSPIKWALFQRDGWHCRFCDVRVIDPRARDILRKKGGLRWGKGNRDRHGSALVHMASHDHVLPRSWGGDNELSTNLVTACWPCQFSRMNLRLKDGCISNPFDREPILDGWDGLVRVL